MWNDTVSVIVYFSILSPGGRSLFEKSSFGCVRHKINRNILPDSESNLFVCLFFFNPLKSRTPKLIFLGKKKTLKLLSK